MASPITAGADELPSLSDAAVWRRHAAFNLAAFYAWKARAVGRPWTQGDDVWAVSGTYPTPVFRSAILVRPLGPVQADDLIGRLGRFYADQPKAPWWLWSAWSSADLQLQGLVQGAHLPMMARLPGATLSHVPQELRVVEAKDAATIADAERVLIDGYPLPALQPVRTGSWFDKRITGGPLRMWVGYVRDRAVATATSFVDQHVNGIHGVATMPEGRGRGYGTALTAQAIEAAPALPAVLSTSGLGHALYTRLGFTEVAHLDLWVKPR